MAAAAPTGCFKCGRPGHWSRDCPSAPSSSSSLPNPNPNPKSKFASPSLSTPTENPTAAKRKAPKTMPKLTPDLLLSDDGLGYVLRHFPKSFKYHGRGHEASDLCNLIGLYTQWHSRLLPYYSFDQFIQKVEQVGATRRVRRCISELRERVARGGDPTKLHEPPVEQVAPDCEQGAGIGDQNVGLTEPPLESHGADEIQEEMADEIYRKATEIRPVLDWYQSKFGYGVMLIRSNEHLEEQREVPQTEAASETPNLVEDGASGVAPGKIQLTEEQKARIEANRLKALERAAARACSSQAP